MQDVTRRLWEHHNRHPGDRERLFGAVHEFTGEVRVLYPGSYIDIAASCEFDRVTYVDIDRRAAQFFSDKSGVDEIIDSNRQHAAEAKWRFIHTDYRSDLDLPDGSVGLLVSLYAGFVSEHCTRYLQIGGWLLVNPSHGDAAMASIDPRYRLGAAIETRSGSYAVRTDDLVSYLVPKRPTEITVESLHQTRRGVAYTKPAFAYLLQRGS